MSTILAVEDDTGTRMLIAALLKKDGHTVLEAGDGQAGLNMAKQHKPDLVLSDVEMPGMTGLDLLAYMRADPDLAETPVVLLTSLEGRAHMRAGMVGGADDYLTKPFRPAELREAVTAQLQRMATRQTLQQIATQQALDEQKDAIDEQYLTQYGSQYNARLKNDDVAPDERFANATVLAVNMHSYAKMAGKLSTTELSDAVRQFFASASDSINLFAPQHVEFEGSGMVALFAPPNDTTTVTHSLRAIKAAFAVVDAAARTNRSLMQMAGDRAMPALEVCVAADSGPVLLSHVKDALGSGQVHTLLVGETLANARSLAQAAAARRWVVAASVHTLRSLGTGVRMGKRELLALPGRQSALDVGEVSAVQ